LFVPPNIDDGLIPFFILGIFEGDGTIYLSENKKIYYFGIVGNEMVCLFIKNFIQEKLDIPLSMYAIKSVNVPLFYIKTGNRNHIRKLYKWMYGHCSFYMNRKYEKFKTIANMPEVRDTKL
jgi:hypothetical protein